jgi:hypothetical protein
MNERRRVEERLRKKEQELAALEEQTKAARVYIQALQDVLKMMPKADSGLRVLLRPGSAVAQARSTILLKGEPVHINEILTASGKETTRENRASLTSSIAAYVRRGEVFTRPAPNTFGLVELGHETTFEDDDDLPPNFGAEEPPPKAPDLRRAPEPPKPPAAPQEARRIIPPPPPFRPPPPPPAPSRMSDALAEDDDIPF